MEEEGVGRKTTWFSNVLRVASDTRQHHTCANMVESHVFKGQMRHNIMPGGSKVRQGGQGRRAVIVGAAAAALPMNGAEVVLNVLAKGAGKVGIADSWLTKGVHVFHTVTLILREQEEE